METYLERKNLVGTFSMLIGAVIFQRSRYGACLVYIIQSVAEKKQLTEGRKMET